MTNAPELASAIRDALEKGALQLVKTANVRQNLGKHPSLVLAELLIKSGAVPNG